MLLHYLGKFKIRNFALFMHVKRFKCEFVSSYDRYLSNIMKISAKINIVKNINILLFVHSLFLTSLTYEVEQGRPMVRFLTGHYRHCSWTSDESISRHVCANVWHFEYLLWKKLQTICNFSCLFGLSGLCPSCQIFTVLTLDGR